MCLYDVKRAKLSGTGVAVDDSTPDNNSTLAIGGNGNRTRVIFLTLWEAGVADGEALEIRVGKPDGPMVARMTKYETTAVLTLELLGTSIGEAFYWRKVGATNNTTAVTEVVLYGKDDLQ